MDQVKVLESVRESVRQLAIKDCEPIVQEALKQCEGAIRTRVAQFAMSIARLVDLEKGGEIITIRVDLSKLKQE